MISFTKAHACGNDFLIVTEDAAAGRDWAELTRRLCERNTGVGADGIEFFAWTGPRSGRIRLHNADGSIAEISGNGTRCVAAWMAEATNARAGDSLEIETDAGLRVCRVNAVHRGNEFTVDITTGMGVPEFAPRTVTIPGGVQVEGVVVNTGNPHFAKTWAMPLPIVPAPITPTVFMSMIASGIATPRLAPKTGARPGGTKNG